MGGPWTGWRRSATSNTRPDEGKSSGHDATPSSSASADGNIVGVGFQATVSSLDGVLRVFRDALGFDPAVGTFSSDRALLDLMGTPGAE